jgi:hypothetical protein
MNFYEFPIPLEINGEQLKSELNCAEVYIRDNVLVIGGNLTQEQAAAGLAAHKPIPAPEPTIADKLASVGLSLDELKSAILGGN